MVIYSRLLLFL
jgi:hypothetical protein